MPAYDPNPIIAASLDELRYISYLVDKYEDHARPRTVLIGGWAVHSYNAWYGSIDIDLITDTRGKKRMLDRLVGERGFVRQRGPDDQRSIMKEVAPCRKVILDLGRRDVPDPFEGGAGSIDYNMLDGQTVWREVASGAELPMPDRTLLLLFKLKASWDRRYRLVNGTSYDPEWERGKLVKDRGDIISLLDPAYGGREVQLDILSDYLLKWPILKTIVHQALQDPEALSMYRKMDKDGARDLGIRLMASLDGSFP